MTLRSDPVNCLSSGSEGTSGGGGGGGVPRICSSTHLPRLTGEVRVGFEVSVRTLGLRQDAAAVGRQLHPAELRALDPLDAVVLRQPLVHEAEVGVQEVEDAAILAEDRLEEQLALADHARPQIVVEAGELLGIGRDVRQLPGRQPLAREVLDEGGRLRVREHPPHLGIEVASQLSPARQGKQLVVGHAAPEEVRQPRGQFVLVDRVARPGLGAGRVQLDAEQEVGPDQHALRGPTGCGSRSDRPPFRPDRRA